MSSRIVACLALIAMLATTSCAQLAAIPSPPPDVDVLQGTPDGWVAVSRRGNQVELLLGQSDSIWTAHVGTPDPGSAVVDLQPFGEQINGWTYNSFVFGASPQAADIFELTSFGTNTTVKNGLFLVALQEIDVHPTQLTWRFLDADGTVIATGRNIFPPDWVAEP